MTCILCLEAKDELSFDIFSAEGKELKAKDILKEHFWMEPKEFDLICGKCWNVVNEFHKFYLQIQKIHQHFEEIKITSKQNNSILNGSFESNVESKVGIDETSVDANFNLLDETIDVDILSKPTKKVVKTKVEKRTDFCNQKNVKTESKIKKRRGRPAKNYKSKSEAIDSSFTLEQNNDLQNGIDYVNLKSDTSSIQQNIENEADIVTKSVRRDFSNFDEFIKKHMNLTCALCHITCENFTILLSHFRLEHKCPGYIMCCGKKLLKRALLVDHLYTHQDPEYFKCKKCNKVLADRRCLDLHQRTHKEKREKIFKCEICFKVFHLKAVFQRHVQNHLPKEQRKFECSQCHKRFASIYLMKNHFRIVHLKKYSQVCEICGKKVHGRELFRIHQEEHKNEPQELLHCDICGLTVKSKYGLKRHQKVKHTEKYQSPQQCKFCSKISPNLIALNRHINFMHQLEKKHKCPMCDKAFKRPKDLKEHLTTHTGDVLYFCIYCPRTFNSNANMYAHRKRKHPKEWEQNHKDKTKFDSNLKEDLEILLKTSE